MLAGCVTDAAGFGPSRLEAESALLVANTCHDYDGYTACTVEQIREVKLDELRCEPLPRDGQAMARASCSVAGTLLSTSGRSRDLHGSWEFRLLPKGDDPRHWIAIPPLS